jgi:hypothetical protein
MNANPNLNPAQTQVLKAERAAHDAVQAAMIARDAIDDCFSTEWRAAHNKGTELCAVWRAATEAAFVAGVYNKPYWWA